MNMNKHHTIRRYIPLICSIIWTSFSTGGFAQTGRAAGQSMIFTGKIGNYPITMQLQSQGQTYRGNYSYDRVGIPMSIAGESKAGIISLEHFSEDPEVFRLTLDPSGNMSGVWDAGGGKKVLPVTLNAMRSAPAFNVYALSDSSKPLQGRPAVRVEYEGEVAWPVGEGRLERFMKQRIALMLGRDTNRVISPSDLMLKQQNGFFKEHLDMIKDLTAAELEDQGSSLSWGMMQVVQVEYRSTAYMCVSSMQWQFTGGAHGNGATLYEIWDLQKLRKTGLKDIITPAGLKALPGLLEKHFRRKYEVPAGAPLQEHGLFENRITEVTDNIYLTSKSLIFSYTPYEIGPYAMGQIEIPIPLAELTLFLQPDFRRWLSIHGPDQSGMTERTAFPNP